VCVCVCVCECVCAYTERVAVHVRGASSLAHMLIAAVHLALLRGDLRIVVVHGEDLLPRHAQRDRAVRGQA
jgi:hypothetical protein